MPEPTPDDMGGDLWAKQAPARPTEGFAFPDALNGKPQPVKKAAKKAKK